MTLATNEEEIVDAEVVEDFNVDDVLKPRPVREVEVYVEDSLERAVRLTREAWARKDAAAVEVGAGIACMATRGESGSNQHSGGCPGTPLKMGVKSAAKRLGKDKRTIRAYLDTWDRLAANGLCAPSTELTPDDLDSLVLPSAEDWQNEWQGNSHSTPAPVFGERGGPTIPHMNDWPVIPEPDDYTEPTPEEKVQRFEETRQRLIGQGLIPRPRTQEEDDAAAERFVQSLTGQTPPRTRAPETPETKLKTLLNEISKLLTEGATLDNLDGLTEAGREAYAKLTKEI